MSKESNTTQISKENKYVPISRENKNSKEIK